jgi:hypothetical protein
VERPKRGRGPEALRRHGPHDSNRQSKQAPQGRTTVQSAYYFPLEETVTKAKNSAMTIAMVDARLLSPARSPGLRAQPRAPIHSDVFSPQT